MPFINPIVN